MDKYYTPGISDLFVGYECEVYDKGIVTLTKEDLSRWLDKGFNIRTPYLTKEQIEKEGWKLTSTETNFGTHEVFFKKGMYQGAEYNLELRINESGITIGYDCLEFLNCNLYEGKCPSINEFRKICKLLGI